jgi:hypothetical protein
MRGRMVAIRYEPSQVFQRMNKEENMRVACISGTEIMHARHMVKQDGYLSSMYLLSIDRLGNIPCMALHDSVRSL